MRTIESPEGVALQVQLADRGVRFSAFALDMIFMSCAITLVYLMMIPLFIARANISVGLTVILFLAFLVRNLYFLHFELAWQGRTPGKRIMGLRVINRFGGPLLPQSVIARNLTREVEVFLPISLLLSTGISGTGFWGALLSVWACIMFSAPLLNRDRLRAGDLIGATTVISVPRRILPEDLSLSRRAPNDRRYDFDSSRLSVYGVFELQVLEELLRRPVTPENDVLLVDVCSRICKKIGWTERVKEEDVRGFLSEFYASEREELERGQLFGRYREDKWDGISK
jgi:uncharacterized RDD family membrane protein YckC